MTEVLCRVCLSDRPTIPIFNSEIKEYQDIPSKFNLCLGEEILDLPSYPRSICEECFSLLNQAVSFIKKFRETCLILEKNIEKVIKQETTDHTDSYSEPEIELPDHLSSNEIKSEFVENNEEQWNLEDNKDMSASNALDRNEPVTLSSSNKKQQTKTKTSVLKHDTSCIKKDKTTAVLKKKLEILTKNGNIRIESIQKSSQRRKRASASKAARKVANSQTAKKDNINNKKRKKCKELSPSVEPPILCEHCGQSFELKTYLQRHKQFHHTEKKSIECPECKKIYSSEHALYRHKKRMHSKDKICSECGKAFSVNSELKIHYNNVHLKMRSYKMHPCKFCGKEYITLKSLLVHERSVHTGERPAICTVCDASFVHDEYLKQHMRLHTGETPFKCPVCGRGYAQSGNMKSHIKHNHSISQLDETTLKTINPRYLKFMKP